MADPVTPVNARLPNGRRPSRPGSASLTATRTCRPRSSPQCRTSSGSGRRMT